MAGRYGLIGLIPVGAVVALAGWVAAGVTIAILGFLVTLLVHLVDGVVGYRRAMDHEWPQVQPPDNDDDW